MNPPRVMPVFASFSMPKAWDAKESIKNVVALAMEMSQRQLDMDTKHLVKTLPFAEKTLIYINVVYGILQPLQEEVPSAN